MKPLITNQQHETYFGKNQDSDRSVILLDFHQNEPWTTSLIDFGRAKQWTSFEDISFLLYWKLL